VQPLLIALILWVFKAGFYTDSYKWITYALLAILPFFAWNISTDPTTVGPNGHLVWNIQKYPSILRLIYYSILSYLFLTMKHPFIGVALLGGYWLSWIYYKTYYEREWASMWCHTVNGVGALALFS
jgi:hypothetical protein